jgi:hypothetical protein
MILQKSHPTEPVLTFYPPEGSPMGPLKNKDAPSPAKKAHAHEIHEKASSISNTCELPRPARDDMRKRLPTKPVWGRTAPVCSVQLSGRASSLLLQTAARRKRAAAPNMMVTSEFQRSWVHSHSIIPRALHQRATQNIDMAV